MCSLFSLPWEDIVFPLILSRLDILDCFSLRDVSSESRRLVESYFQYMRVLNLSKYANSFSSYHFKILSKHCMSLRKVILSRCTWLRDDLVKSLFSQNKAISYLVLNHCENLTTACLQSVILHCKGLKTLRMQGCPWLTFGCLEAITLHQTALEDIDLGSSHLSTNKSINCFFSKFPNLKSVNLERNQIMDNTLIVISQVCQKLENINVRFCPHITDLGIRYLIQFCPTLKCLLLFGSMRISPECIHSLPLSLVVDIRKR